MAETGLVQILEGALLAAGRPLTVAQLGELFEERERPDNSAIREALDEVAARCEDRGFELREVASGFRFQVRQNLSPWVARLWNEKPQRYSRALLETLSLIAYRQPITRGEIEEVRGVAVSSNIVRTLHEREWIRVVGHRDVPGRPAMYATTRQFLDYFNLKSLDQLPALAEIEDLDSLNVELGFSEPGAGAPDDTGAEGGPELTVVGGTEHTPVLGSVAPAGSDGPPVSRADEDSRTPHDADASAAMPQAEGDTGAGPDASAAMPEAEGDTGAEPDASAAMPRAEGDTGADPDASGAMPRAKRPCPPRGLSSGPATPQRVYLRGKNCRRFSPAPASVRAGKWSAG
ncbi:MAG: SMC-Scp complex subunit ScpB [Halioglobus sp.]|nr:SMC-Scp complex subunit ScpB [Halioglobus sp.]